MRYRFQGTLTSGDMKRHILHPFEVPPHATRLDIRFHYTAPPVDELRNLLCLSLFDPTGFRGAAHRGGGDQHVHISLDRATPGYRPGTLPPGPWTIEIETHRIIPGAPCDYRLDIVVETSSADPPSPAPSTTARPQPVLRRTAGWYRGDLHAHTIHSDGTWDMKSLTQIARAYRLDFITITDHNTVTGLADIPRNPPEDLLIMAGMELTTFWGHALSLGTYDWIDWRVRPGERSMADIAHEVAAMGGLFVIAHPGIQGDPVCTGCDWRYPEVMPGPAHVVEVWNGPWDEDSENERSLAMWYVWMNQGHRLVATAGTDAHGPTGQATPADLNVGFNVVHADALSQEAILQAIARGHLYLSSGPRVDLHGRAQTGEHAMMGDVLPCGAAEIRVSWDGCPSHARARLIADGAPLDEWRPDRRSSRSWTIADGQARWCLVEIRDGQSRLLALTNPIFLGDHWFR